MAERQSLTFGPFRRNLPHSRLWRQAQSIILQERAPDGPHQPAQSGSRTVPCPDENPFFVPPNEFLQELRTRGVVDKTSQ